MEGSRLLNAAYELNYLRAGVDLLEPYLLSNDVYRPVRATTNAGDPPYPSLTLGGLLLARARLSSAMLPADLQAERDRVLIELDALRAHWQVAWERKAGREFDARLKQWADYLDEYHSDPENNADRYGYEVGRRVMLHLLDPYAREASQAEKDLIHRLDILLHAVFLPGEFIWDEWQKPAFSPQMYWYLYGKIRV